MLEGDCAIHVSYNPCVTDHFECVITFPAANEYGLIEQEMCQQDFEDPEFWSLMREDQFWEQNPQHADFHMFWDMFHYDHHDDYNDYEDCEWREVFGDCQDWQAHADEQCQWYISYSPCVHDHFICEVMSLGEYGEELNNCTTDFEDPESWAQMREEAFWFREENEEHFVFYTFWDEYHYGMPDDCEWKVIDISCDEFEFITEECHISTSYSPCETDYFYCTVTKNGEYGPYDEDCTEDFEDIEFWSIMRMEEFWFEESNAHLFDFYEFWQEYHFGHHDYDDYEQDCEWRHVQAECRDFEMLEGDCAIYASYSPCETDYFVCEITMPATDYSPVDFDYCNEDFEDADFWYAMRQEQFWMDHQEYAEFFMFWDMYHMDHHDDYNDWNDYDMPDYDEDWNDWNDYDMPDYDEDWNDWNDYDMPDYNEDWNDYDMPDYDDYWNDWNDYEHDDYNDWNDWNDYDHDDYNDWNDYDHDDYNDWEDWNDYDHDDYNDYNDYDDEMCEYVQIDTTCGAFSFSEDECQIKAEYNRCPWYEHFICDEITYNEYQQMHVQDCAEKFEDAEFWAVMREEQFWIDNMDQYWDFYGFFEEYHRDGRDGPDDNGECVQCEEYDCTADAGLDHCTLHQCYDSCMFVETCDATWSTPTGAREEGSCDEFWAMISEPVYEPDCEEYSYCHAP
jgi:hypothetical protein